MLAILLGTHAIWSLQIIQQLLAGARQYVVTTVIFNFAQRLINIYFFQVETASIHTTIYSCHLGSK